MDGTTSKEQKLQKIIELEKKLGEIQDVDVLLERILTETREIVHADAGSIYVVEGNNLRIKYSQNDTLLRELTPGEKLPYPSFSFPINETSVAGYVAYAMEPVNIKDAYTIPENLPYKFNKQTDKATNYRTKSIYTLPLKMSNGRLLGVLQIINAQNLNGDVIEFDDDATLYITHFASSTAQALEHTYLTLSMVRRMLKMAEFRDPKETYPHVTRVSEFSKEIYDRWSFKNNIPDAEAHKFRDSLTIAAKFHDVGKVGISDTILKKVSPRFTPEERAIMEGHTCIGANLFEPCDSFLDEMCRDVALHHHDRWDGGKTGYPGKFDHLTFIIGQPVPESEPLQGTNIPLAARIVAVADVFDALSHKRCYKDAWDVEQAFREIQNDAGSHFDPEIVADFLQIHDRICTIYLQYPDAE
ncbi:MAG: HD domain-containing protein [Treponema sp.]|nr:HD domain-containing protein [Treponema sp.]